MTRVATAVLLIAFALAAPASERLIAAITAEQLEAFSAPDNVTAQVVTIDGRPGIQLNYSGPEPRSVTIAELPTDRLNNRRIRYRADVSSSNLKSTACLELYAVVAGQAYYSRAVYDELSGTMSAREISAPFLLRPEDYMDAARLGIRFDGPGTVTVSNLQLYEIDAATGWLRPHQWTGLAGAAVGVFSSIWGCLALILSWKGIGRGPVLHTTLSTAVFGAVATVSGALLYANGTPRDVWYALVLLGVITAVNFSVLYAALYWLYGKAETRRMLAMDIQ